MKLYAALLLISTSIQILAMDSPGRGGKEGKLTDSQHKRRSSSSKNLNLLARAGSGSPSATPSSSKIEGRTPPSMSPEKLDEKKGSDIRRVSVANIQRTLAAFAQEGIEEDLSAKFETAKKFKDTNRFEYDSQLRVILEIKVAVASAAKHNAAQALFESAETQVRNACDNFEEYQRAKNKEELKTALLDILKAREAAEYAIGKRLCADHPNKYDAWCRYETDIDEKMLVLNERIRQFFVKIKVTEEMKTKDAPSHQLP